MTKAETQVFEVVGGNFLTAYATTELASAALVECLAEYDETLDDNDVFTVAIYYTVNDDTYYYAGAGSNDYGTHTDRSGFDAFIKYAEATVFADFPQYDCDDYRSNDECETPFHFYSKDEAEAYEADKSTQREADREMARAEAQAERELGEAMLQEVIQVWREDAANAAWQAEAERDAYLSN